MKKEIEFKNFEVFLLHCFIFPADIFSSLDTFLSVLRCFSLSIQGWSLLPLDEKHRWSGVLSPGVFNDPETCLNHNFYRRCLLGILKEVVFSLQLPFPSLSQNELNWL